MELLWNTLIFSQGQTVELVKLIPDGLNVVGVIVVVVLFLNQQNKFSASLKEMNEQSQLKNAESQKAFQDQLTALTNQSLSTQKSYQDQVQMLMEQNMKIARETISTLKSVDAMVRELKDRFVSKRESEKHE